MAEKSARLVDSRPKMKKCNFSDSFFFGKLRLKVMVIKTSYAFSYLKTAYSTPNFKKVSMPSFALKLKICKFLSSNFTFVTLSVMTKFICQLKVGNKPFDQVITKLFYREQCLKNKLSKCSKEI